MTGTQMNDARLTDCWLSERLDQLSKFIDYRGKTPKKKPEGLPLITAKNIRDGYIKREPREYIAIEDYDEWMTRGIPREGDVVITTEAPMGNAALLNITEKFAIAQRIICMQFYISAMGRFAHYALRSPEFQKTLTLNSTGTTVSGIKAATLKGLLIPVPPLAEQKVIANKLDTLLAQVENTKARLERIPKILKRFRQSVLAAAVSGRLTEEWRNEVGLSEWSYVRLDKICNSISDGDHQAPPRAQNGIPFLVISNVTGGDIDFDNVSRWVPEEYYNSLKSIRKPSRNDLLYTVTGSFGIPVVVNTNKLFCFQRHIAIIKPNHSVVSTRYLAFYLQSPKAFAHAQSVATGTAQKTVSLTNLRKFPISLPTMEEQTEIVHQVDQLFAHADRIEQQVNKALARVNNLTQSILAKAFRGELTKQWRKDNPELISGENSAEALLERVKAERAASQQPKRRKRKA